MMQIKGFKRALKKLAKGKYHHVKHSITEYHNGEIKEEWSAYMDGNDWTSGHNTPEEAIKEMKRMRKEN